MSPAIPRSWSVCALIFVACGASPSHHVTTKAPDALDHAIDRLVAAARHGDAAAIAGMLAPSVGYGGLWFDDATCRQQLATGGTIARAGFDVLARCLATLPLERSTRRSATPNAGVMTYAPGIEIEVAFDGRTDDAKVRWIGYAGRRGAEDALPTITPEALEGLRTGHRRTVAKDPASVTWLEICLDATGAVQSVRPRAATSWEALPTAVATAKQWRFRPFTLGGKPAPVCSMVALADPAGDDVEPATLPIAVPDRYSDSIEVRAAAMEKKRIAGSKILVPDDEDKDAILRSRKTRLESVFELCVERTGDVGWILMLQSSGFPRYDARIATGLAGWRFSPFTVDGSPVPVCTWITLIYVQKVPSRIGPHVGSP